MAALPVLDGSEDVVRLEEPGEEEEEEHDASGPVEELQGERGREGWARQRFRFAEDEAAEERDAGGEREKEQRVDDSVADGLVGLEEELGIFEGEEESMEDGVEGEQTEKKGYGFGEFEQHTPGSLGLGVSLLLCGVAA